MAAFEAAYDLGYRHLEMDVRVTADRVSVVFHDHMLDRVTNHLGRLEDLPWRVVKQARVLGREPIPLLEDVLARFTDCVINIDVKSNIAVGPALDAIRRANAASRIRIAGFSHTRLKALRAAIGPSVASGLTPREIAKLAQAPGWFRLPAGVDWAAQVPAGPRWLPLVTPRFVESAHRLGMQVHVWTVNDRAEMVRLLNLGVDGIMTDEALLLKQVLQERGQWD